jgi:RNA polymerase sigma factor (sigma-70 family)
MPMIRLMVCQMGGSVEDSKDIFQDGLMIMLEKIDNKDFVLTCKFKTFLYCVCENLWKAILVKRQSASNYLTRRIETDSGNDFTELLDNKLYQTIFTEVFDSLDNVSKKILKLYWHDVSPQEIAERLGYSYGYVRKKKCEAQGELIEKVKQHPDYRRIMISDNIIKNVVY